MTEGEIEGGNNQDDQDVDYLQGVGEVMTPLAVEGYERWEDSMLVKFSEFLGFLIVGFDPQIIDLIQKLVANQNQGLKLGQTPMSRCERELKKVVCTVNYNGRRSGKGANRDRGNLLMKLI